MNRRLSPPHKAAQQQRSSVMEASVLPKSTSRQLARRRREQRSQRQEELLDSRMPDEDAVHRLAMRVVHPSVAPATPASRKAVRCQEPAKPTRQKVKTQTFGYSNPYAPFKGEKSWQPAQRKRTLDSGSAVPPLKNRKDHQPRQWNSTPIKAKVDSHWGKPSHHHKSAQTGLRQGNGPATDQGMPKNKKNKSLAAAHEQLELMMTRIERARDYLPPPPQPQPAVAANRRRGGGQHVAPIRGGIYNVPKVAKGMRLHMAEQPPVPPCSPMTSARLDSTDQSATNSIVDNPQRLLPTKRDYLQLTQSKGSSMIRARRNSTAQSVSRAKQHDSPEESVPLVQNPQSLVPAKRDALLELLQQKEQRDRGIVDMVRGRKRRDHGSNTTIMTIKVLPLRPNESPYSERARKRSESVKERHERQQSPRTESKELRKMLSARTWAEVLRANKPLLVAHSDNKIPQLNERQKQAMRERIELEHDKEQVTICRERQHQREQVTQQREHSKHLAERKIPHDGEYTKPQGIRLRDPLAAASVTAPIDPCQQLLEERNRFRDQCEHSDFYNNSQCPEPWKLYARLASKLTDQAMDMIIAKFNRKALYANINCVTL